MESQGREAQTSWNFLGQQAELLYPEGVSPLRSQRFAAISVLLSAGPLLEPLASSCCGLSSQGHSSVSPRAGHLAAFSAPQLRGPRQLCLVSLRCCTAPDHVARKVWRAFSLPPGVHGELASSLFQSHTHCGSEKQINSVRSSVRWCFAGESGSDSILVIWKGFQHFCKVVMCEASFCFLFRIFKVLLNFNLKTQDFFFLTLSLGMNRKIVKMMSEQGKTFVKQCL